MTEPSYPPYPRHPGTPPESSLRPKSRGLPVTIVLMVLYAVPCGLATLISPLLFMAGDNCTDQTCDYDQMTAGIGIVALGPWIPVVLAIVGIIIRVRRATSSWWIPLIAAPVSFAILYGGFSLLINGAG